MFTILSLNLSRIFTILGVGLATENDNYQAQKCNSIAFTLYIFASLLLLLNWELVIRHHMGITQQYWIDGLVWLILLFNYILLLSVVNNKMRFIRHNWLLAIILVIGIGIIIKHPTLANQITYLRPLLAILILSPALRFLFSLFVDGRLWTTIVAALVIVAFFGILVSIIDPSIGGVGNGLWWALATVSTVGYGDIVPDTFGGRVLGAILIVVGLGLFVVITANFLRIMLAKEAENSSLETPGTNPEIQAQLKVIHSNQQKTLTLLSQLKQKIDGLESKDSQ